MRYGIDHLGSLSDSAIFIGTFQGNPSKAVANRTLQKFTRWIRRDLGIPIAYAVVWEVQKRGALHANVLLSPWPFVPWKTVFNKWHTLGGGRSNYIARPQGNIISEVAKADFTLNAYLHKMEQMVLTGRAISYSRNWPRKPVQLALPEKKKLFWLKYPEGHIELTYFYLERDLGYWKQIRPGVWGKTLEPKCDCFRSLNAPHNPGPAP